MEESYRVGVSIALSGDIGTMIGKVIEQFERLDKAVNHSKENISGLKDGLKGVAGEAKSAADAWQKVANSISSATKAAQAAARASGSLQPQQPRASNRATSDAQAAINAANAANNSNRTAPANSGAIVPYTGGAYQQPRGRYPDPASAPTIALPYDSSSRDLVPIRGGMPVPYWNGNRDFNIEGDPYTPYGEYPMGRPPRGPGTAVGPYTGGPGTGFTLNGGPEDVPGSEPRRRPPRNNGSLTTQPHGEPMDIGSYPYWADDHNLAPTNRRQEMRDFHGQFNGMAMLPDIAGFEWMKSNWEKSASYKAEQAHLVQQGFTPEEASKAGDTSLQVQRDVGPISPESVLHIVDKLMNVTQDKAIATNKELLEQYAKTSVVLSSYGHGGELHELDAAIRAGEFRGVLTHEGKDGKQEIDTKGLSEFLQQLSTMTSISGGDISPSKVLATLRAAGSAGSIISKDELTRMMAMIIASGTSRAGSNLQGFEQQFTAGRMSEAGANLLIQMDVIKGGGDAKHNPYLKKSGMGQFLMTPGAMDEGAEQEAAKEPSMFIMHQLLPKFKEQIRKVYGSRYDEADEKGKLVYESKFAQMTASRMGGGVEMTEVIRNILLMQRDVEAAQRNLKLNNYDIQVQQNPLNAPKAMGAAYQGLQIQLGNSTMEPATQAINNITGALNDLATWTTNHGEITRVGMEALAGALVALGAVGIIALAGTLGGLTGALAALGAATAGAVEGIKAIDEWLHKTFHGVIGTNADVDKAQKSIRDHGVEVPWWMPLPVGEDLGLSFGGKRESRPPWAQWHLFGNDANGATPAAPGASRPTAPTAANTPAGPKGTHDDPIVTYVQNQPSGSDIARGVSSNMASKANRPSSGYTGADTRMDPLGLLYGFSP